MHKIHTPSLVQTTRHGSRSTVEGDMFSSAHPHAELQSIQAIQPSDALPIDEPPLTPQQDPDPHVAKSRPRMRQIPNV